MARTNPHHDWDEPAGRSPYARRHGGAEWESLRNEIVALLDHVEDQVAGARQVQRVPAPRPADTGRRHEALRSVRLAVDRLAEKSEPDMAPPREPAPRAVRDNVTEAINQIRARQTGAARPVVSGQASELAGFAQTVAALGERIESFEARIASKLEGLSGQAEIAAQVAQLSEVIELLASAVGENGQVQRINQLADTVDRLASHQVESTGRNQQFQDRQDAGLQAIEETVRNIYERIDALEAARGDSPEIESIGRDIGAISSALAASEGDASEILARIDALQARITETARDSHAAADLGFSIEALRDAIVDALEPRFEALARDSRDHDRIESQLRHIVETVDKTSAQLQTLAAFYEAEAGNAAGETIAKADLDALESRLARLFSAEAEPAAPDPGLAVVRDSIAQVDNRLERLEAMLNGRSAATEAKAEPRRRGPSDTMPKDPVSGAPRKVLSEDPAITLDPGRAQSGPGFRIDPDTIVRPPKPQSSFASEGESLFVASAPPAAAEPREPAGARMAASRSSFIEAARRSARQPVEDEPGSRSLIARALSRFQKAETEEAGPSTPHTPPQAEPALDTAPDPLVDALSNDMADDRQPGFLARNRRALLLGAALAVVIALSVPLVLNRLSGPAPVAEPASAPPAPAASATPVPEAAPTSDADDEPQAPGDMSELISGVRMIDTAPALTPARLDAEAISTEIDPIRTAALANSPDTSIGHDDTGGAARSAASPLPEITVPIEIEPELLRTAAESGDPRAQFEIGAILTEGHVVEQDLAQAAAWYERSAAQGFAPAQYRLGNLYEGGRGVERDMEMARLWYQRAAEAGNRMSMHNLASLYAGGELETQDFAAAAHWFEQAASRGLTDSQFNLGMLHARGLGVEQSFEDSYFWFSLAAQSGDEDAKAAREDVARSLDAEAIQRIDARIAAWRPAEIDMAANFAPIGTWDDGFDTGQAIANREVVARVQMLLSKLGYDVGQPDGIAGPRTRDAILAFERATGMNEKGEINPRLLAVLGSQPV